MLSFLVLSYQQQYDVMYVNDSTSFHNCIQQNKNQTCVLTEDLIVILKNNFTIQNRSILGNNHNLTIIKSRNESVIFNNTQFYNVQLALQGNVLTFIDYQKNTQWYDCVITSLLDVNATTQNIILDSVDSEFINCQFYLIQPQTLFALNIRNNTFENNTFEIYNSSVALTGYNVQESNFTNNAFYIQNMTQDMNIIEGEKNIMSNTILRIAYSNNKSITLNNQQSVCNVTNFYYTVYENQNQTMRIQDKQNDITNKYLYFTINQVPTFINDTDIFQDNQIATYSLKINLNYTNQYATVIQFYKLVVLVKNDCQQENMIYFGKLCLDDECGLNNQYNCDYCSINEDIISNDEQQEENYQFICQCNQNFNETTYCTSCYDKYIGSTCKIERYLYGGVYTGLVLLALVTVVVLYWFVQRKAIDNSNKAMKEVDDNEDSSSYL